jgi:hypothetical protein
MNDDRNCAENVENYVKKIRGRLSIQENSFFPRNINTNIQNVISSKQNTPVISTQTIINPLNSSLQQNIHVTITLNHSAPILNSILQNNSHITIQLLSQDIQRLSTRLHQTTNNN